MRFAWERKNSPDYASVKQGCTVQLIRMVYNIVWWIPIVLALFKVIDYRTGFILFTIVTLVRLAANLYVNNVLTAEQAEGFPFRT
jgi:hypothetical protein